MIWGIRFHDEAKFEGDNAIDWYFGIEPRIGERFRNAVENAIDMISETPHAFPVIAGSSVRRILVRGFPYVVIYSVTETDIFIISIFHTSRNPIVWEGREY